MERESGEGSEGEDGRGLPDPAVVKSYYFTVKKRPVDFPDIHATSRELKLTAKRSRSW